MLKINLKTIAGLFVAVAIFAGATTASAWTATMSAKITKASSSADVMWLQQTLNAVQGAGLVEDGKYGAKTTAAIKVFQVAHPTSGIADGIAGRLTIAALNAAGANLSATSSVPGCAAGATFSATTGLPCSGSVVSTVPGCVPGAAFSATTGASCAGSTIVVNDGAQGTLTNVSKLSSYNSTKVIEGAKDVPVLGIQATAKDGSQNIDGIKVAFKNVTPGLSNVKLSKYISDISVWLDGKEIARKSVLSFSDDAGDTYTYRFTGMAGMIPVGTRSNILVAVTGASSLDSTDASAETWSIGAGTVVTGDASYITASSANGRYEDYGSSGVTSTIDFQKAGGVSSDQKYKVNISSSNPAAQTTQVSRTSDTTNVLLLAFDAKAENGAMKIQRIPVTFTSAIGLADGVTPNPEAILKTVRLFANGTEIANESIATGVSPVTVTFGNTTKLNYSLATNATVKFEVKADLNDIEDTGIASTDFDEGDQIKADYSSTNVTNSTVELDNVNGDTVSNRSGAGVGEYQTARSTGGLVTMGTTSYAFTPNTSGSTNNKTIISIPVTVKAFDDTLYVGQTATAALVGALANQVGFSYTLNNGAAPSTQVVVIPSGATTAPTSTISSSAPVSGSAWRIDSGTSQTFTIQVTLSGATAAASMRVQLQDFQFYTDAALTAGEVIQNLAPMSSFQSVYSPIF